MVLGDFHIKEDIPETRLILARAKSKFVWSRLFTKDNMEWFFLGIVPTTVLSVSSVAFFFRLLQNPKDIDTIIKFIIVLGSTIFIFYYIFKLAKLTRAHQQIVHAKSHRIVWDQSTQTFSTTQCRRFRKPKTLSLPFSSLEKIDFVVLQEEQETPLDLTLELIYTKNDSDESLEYIEIPLTVVDINQRSKAMDFFFRVANILRQRKQGKYHAFRNNQSELWAWYFLERSDPRFLKISFIKEADKIENLNEYSSLLPIEEPANYASEKFQGPHLPAYSIEPFQSKDFQSSPELIAWKPKELIKLFAPIPEEKIKSTTLLGPSDKSYKELQNLSPKMREVIFDWSQKTLFLYKGIDENPPVQVPFSMLQSLVLKGKQKTIKKGNERHTFYWCELWLDSPSREFLLRTEYFEDFYPDEVYKQIEPFVHSLAQELYIPWKWIEFFNVS